MLSQLYIENIAVIEKAEIDFRKGFNVLTGETGAGKSILIDSIHAVLGERISRELVRTGASSAFVSASFEEISTQALEKAETLGIPLEEGVLLVQREIHADGKSSCRINGRPVTVSILKELGGLLINIHGQHENYGLLSPERHLMYLDHLGGHLSLLHTYQKTYDKMAEIQSRLQEFQIDEAQKARKIDLLTYQIDELEAADLHEGEQEELLAAKNRYRNSEKIASSLNLVKTVLDGDEDNMGALSSLTDALDAMENVGAYLPGAKSLAERMKSLVYDLQDCNEEIRALFPEIEYDPDELNQIEERLDMIYRLGLKYGKTIEAMLAFLEECRKELESIQFADEKTAELEKQYRSVHEEAEKLAQELFEKRSSAAKTFEKSVQTELAFLDMPNVRFVVDQQECNLYRGGKDKVQFLISTNLGEPPKPISKIASGGELSRIMLAIKTVLADKDELDTLIFDEVDTGISGSAAQKVGLKLNQVAGTRQVICVTHSAQIAALAGTHYLIKKNTDGKRTFTSLNLLDFEGRKQELARIIGGTQITPITLQNAEEMLHMAGF